jgi:hypothetical protein
MYICQLVWKKINQEITVVHKTQSYIDRRRKKIPPVIFKNQKIEKIKTTNHCQKQHFGNEKIEKKSYPYVHTLSLASKECKRLL